MARLACGHLSFKGWIKPPEELERLGLLNEHLQEQADQQKHYTEQAERRAIAAAERALWKAERRGSLAYDLERWHARSR